MDISKIHERQELRCRILKKLYELLHAGGPEWPSSNNVEGLIGTKKELYIDNEHHKAYHYLHTKGYIQISSLTPNAKRSDDERLVVMITADGIDYIEAIALSKQDKT